MEVASAREPVILPAARILPEAREPLPDYVGPSNRVNAVGQTARSAVQDARNAGVDLPRNAQGYAASRIARGADPESVFSALIADPGPAVDAAETPEEVVAPVENGDVAPVPDEAAGSGEVISLVPADDPALDPAETALDLLTSEPAKDQVA